MNGKDGLFEPGMTRCKTRENEKNIDPIEEEENNMVLCEKRTPKTAS